MDPKAIDWSRVMPSGPHRGTVSPPPTPPSSSEARPDAIHPSPPPPVLPVIPPNPIHTHPLVASGQISADLAHLLVEVNFARTTGKVRRNISKARVLTAQEMTEVIEEAEDRAARREAQALARRDQEQQLAEDIGLANTSFAPPSGSHPSRRRGMSPGASSASSFSTLSPIYSLPRFSAARLQQIPINISPCEPACGFDPRG